MTETSNNISRWQHFLSGLERAGNRLPVPAVLFIWLCLFLVVLSWLFTLMGTQAYLPGRDEPVVARSLLSPEGLRWMLTNTVDNFIGFAPVGSVLVVMLGMGVAEHSGLLKVLLERLVLAAPRVLLTWVVVLAGILSNLAMDAGYVVLIPLAAMLFAVAGRPALAGVAAAFAGVSAGYSANLLLGPVDAIMAGMTTEAAALVAEGYQVGIASNYYFAAVSTLLLSGIGVWVTEKLVVPYLGAENQKPVDSIAPLSAADRRGLWAVLAWTLVLGLLLAAGSATEGGWLRDPERPGFLASAVLQSIVVVIALYAGIAGWLFGRVSGRYRDSRAAVQGMETSMSTMATYLVLMFFAAQFVNYFAWSQLGTIMAATGAQLLQGLELNPGLLLLLLVLITAVINLFVGSASAKWALLGPVFVPMLYLLGVSPEATQMAYRIGDSSTNIITPLMPYFGVVIAFAQRYRSDFGIGTLVAMMLPYSLAFLVAWSGLLITWFWLGWPLGPGAPMLLG
ncbi:AbgT family transporter [Marinimicrobium sp. ABcell2]|uniref:AbgT family transporter n=1 Tax=Marinimicrobium sp. ABcell2 TaxID=3069751 RepID=UPI0027B811F0|nr:AbgT family transporter [Marinimicrobium sp. ABcell2]MDQ2077953.1 AbgT family transporter [Marinimicrobium sp. ABcell2]